MLLSLSCAVLLSSALVLKWTDAFLNHTNTQNHWVPDPIKPFILVQKSSCRAEPSKQPLQMTEYTHALFMQLDDCERKMPIHPSLHHPRTRTHKSSPQQTKSRDKQRWPEHQQPLYCALLLEGLVIQITFLDLKPYPAETRGRSKQQIHQVSLCLYKRTWRDGYRYCYKMLHMFMVLATV